MLTELKIEIPPAEADALNDLLLEHGWEQWSILESAVQRRSWLVGIFAGEVEARAALAALAAASPALAAPAVEQRELADADWRDSYKAHFHAWKFGRLHWVPVWERPGFTLPPGDAVLWLDPGMAFGTGNHETTRLCVERLAALASTGGRPQASVIDAGCGSGILALSAMLLGFGPTVGFDLDPEAVRVSRENAELNGLGARVEFFAADLGPGLRGRSADVVVANIQADVLQQSAAVLLAAVAPGGSLLLSGILAGECESVRSRFQALAPGWVAGSRTLGEWSDLQFDRPAAS